MSTFNLNDLKTAPKKYLLSILTSMGVNYDYVSENKDYAELIINKLNDQKVAKKKSPQKLNQICYQLFYISLFIALFLMLILMLFYLFPKKTKFCDSNLFNSTKQLNCIRCPIFATCSSGSCMCDLNYTQIKNYCIFNDEDKFLVFKMVDNAYDILKKRSGSYYCQKSQIDWMSVEELEVNLLKNSKLNISKFHIIYQKTLAYLYQDPNLRSYQVNNVSVFVSTEINININCKIEQYLYKRVDIFIMISASLVFLAFILFFYERSKRKKLIATRYSRSLVDHLRDKKGVPQSRTQLIYYLDSISNNNAKLIWPLVERPLHRYSNVQCFNDGVCTNYRYIK